MDIHVFSNIGGTIESSLVSPAQKIATSLSAELIPYVAGGLTIWVMVYALATVRGAVHTPANDFAWRLFKVSLILSFGTAGGIFQPDAHGFYSALSNTIYNAITTGGGGTCPVPANDAMGIYGALDCGTKAMATPLLANWEKTLDLIAPPGSNWYTVLGNVLSALIPLLIFAFMAAIGLILTIVMVAYMGFEVIALRTTIALAFALSPIFIYSLLFEPIKNIFSGWLNVIIESIIFQALMLAFMGVAFGAITSLVNDMLLVSITTDLIGMLLASIIGLISFCIMMVIFIFTAARLQSLASRLSGGGGGSPGLGTLIAAGAGRQIFKLTSGKMGSNPRKQGQGGEVTNNS